MGSEVRARAALGWRAASLGVVLTALVPSSAHAADVWCWLFGDGCGGDRRTSEQALPGRAVPESDPSTLADAIALAAGGAALVRGRVRARRRR